MSNNLHPPFRSPYCALLVGIAGLTAGVAPANGQTTWRQVASGTTVNLRSVAFLNGQFIACGENAGTEKEPLYGLVSSDGEHWRKTQLANLKELTRVGNRVAGIPIPISGEVYAGAGLYLTRDGFSAAQIGPVQASGKPLATIAAITDGDGRWLAAGDTRIFRYEWDDLYLLGGPTSNSGVATGLAYGNGLFLRRDKGSGAYVYQSQDGINWQPIAGITLTARRLIFGNGLFLSHDGIVSKKSADSGVTWTDVSGTPVFINWLTFADGKFAIAGGGGAYFSPDGENWIQGLSVPAVTFNGIAYGEAGIAVVPPVGRWVAVGNNGKIYISDSDAAASANQTLTINGAVQLRWLGEVGESYQVQSSTNMAAWQDTGDVIPGTGIEIVVSQPIVPPSRFFRVVPQ